MFLGGLARARDAGRKSATEKEGSGGPALRNRDRESTGPASSREDPQEPHRGAQTSGVMAEKTTEETWLWNGAIRQDASVSQLSHPGPGVGWGGTDLSFLPWEF